MDVPYVPTAEPVVEQMLNLAGVGPGDTLYDLGSGDGRIVVSAARDRGARGFGIELDLLRIAEAMEYAGCSGVEQLVDFIEEDVFSADISQASVVTLYLLQSVNLDLRQKLITQLRPGTRIVSHAFNMGCWMADDWVKMNGVTIYKWIVPAKVAGIWEWEGRDCTLYRIDLKQKYQQVTGNAWLGGDKMDIDSAVLQGDIAFGCARLNRPGIAGGHLA